ncbi:MAG: DUF3473 domain-containing protein [Proteobacteria bacterium]|nr:DUF3473 domain-containing protein [Pseudomonadota bacterium]
MLNALTIDVEDYFMVSAFADTVKFDDWSKYESRVEASTELLLDRLDTHETKATFFTLGWIAERYPGLVKKIAARGHELASHGYSHRLVYDLTPQVFREDTRKTKRIIEDVIGAEVVGYRAASYSVTKRSLWALDILAEEGFIYDSSIFPIRHDRYGYIEFDRFSKIVELKNSRQILELPLSTVRLFGRNLPVAGGGYLRLLPLKFIKWGLGNINRKEKRSAIIYLHPWEVDPGQPRINGSWLSCFRHNTNLKKTEQKLVELMENFKFAPMKIVYADQIEEVKRGT